MALILKDRVLETCSSPGTGAVTLLGATVGYQTFSAAIGNGNTCYYTISDQNGVNWEVGLGTYATSGNTLTRTTVLSSSNSGSTVNFNTGTQNVFVTYPSEQAVYQDANGYITSQFISSLQAFAIKSTGQINLKPLASAPTGAAGDIIFNSTSSQFQGYNGTAWLPVGGAVLSNDTSTATSVYPLFANATSGTATTIYTSNANLLYTPSTGELTAQTHVSANGLTVNSATVSANYTIPSGSNAISAGPVTVASGITVTVPSGSVWYIS